MLKVISGFVSIIGFMLIVVDVIYVLCNSRMQK